MRERCLLNLILSFSDYRPWAVAAFLAASLVGIVPKVVAAVFGTPFMPRH